jgi:hypothetical protein
MRQPGMSNLPFSPIQFPLIALPSTGIGPERFAFISVDGGYTGEKDPASTSQLNFNAEHGFYITAPDYILRPEVLESNFYAWRVTGNTTYLDRAASAVTKFEEYLKVKETGGYTMWTTPILNESTTRKVSGMRKC